MVAAEEILGSDPQGQLFQEEEHLMAGAVESRRRDVIGARVCARRARIGVSEMPILRGERGEPRWPRGVVGRMTHTAGYYAAAVARSRELVSIGIDAEGNEVLPSGVLRLIAPAEEEVQWLGQHSQEATCWDRLFFSAKESVYKSWYPLTGRVLGFEDVLMTTDPAKKIFRARLLVDTHFEGGSSMSTINGRYLVRGGFVLTAAIVSR